jgi:HAD superfamily hydrolase (TIGR01509 family)
MAVIFDCDGVLVDGERWVCQVEARLLSEWGWPMTADDARTEFKGRAFPSIARSIEERLGGCLPEHWTYLWAMETASHFQAELREIVGVRAILERLIERGSSLCVASQSPLPRVTLSLGICDLSRYFRGSIFTSSMVARPKPAPDLFLHAAARLGAAPAECTVIEDSPSGVRAARAANMRVLGFAADENAEGLAAEGATPFFDMAELSGLLPELG